MNQKINFWLDIILAVMFIPVAISSLVFFFGLNTSFLGIPSYGWRMMHNNLGMIFIILMLIHIILHINWFWCMIKGFFHKSN
ncbi:DUF4405 domain-containing protein [Candidatus Woesearchaeota archaeon]|nr:DUF4405 domain-containing protein [Candidatus Woesearchaeota archaeon]